MSSACTDLGGDGLVGTTETPVEVGGGPLMSAQNVTVNAPVTFRRWNAPSFAQPVAAPGRRQDGFKPVDGMPVSGLPPAVLDALAAAWLEDLYAKTGRPCPFALRGTLMSAERVREKVSLGGKTYVRFVPRRSRVRDGTVRCTFCGQIDDPDVHDEARCPATAGDRS